MHPRPPSLQQDSTERDLELVLVGREIKQRGHPAILLGDLNDVAWSPSTMQFTRAGGLLDPRRGRGFFNTYPAGLPGLRYPLRERRQSVPLSTELSPLRDEEWSGYRKMQGRTEKGVPTFSKLQIKSVRRASCSVRTPCTLQIGICYYLQKRPRRSFSPDHASR
jgi:hypothetical protein